MKVTFGAALLLGGISLGGCTSLVQYRTQYLPCQPDGNNRGCANSAIEVHPQTGADEPGFSLSFIEFDDQGQLFDRAQMFAVLKHIDQTASQKGQDILLVVFVHGWKHNAKDGDDNIDHFRNALRRLSRTELALSRAQGRTARKVAGIYIGWRGLSISAPVLKELTFWDRKNTAEKIGHGEVTEVLNRLDQVRRAKDAEAAAGTSGSRLVIVGHSFGGALVYTAIAQILDSRFVQTSGTVDSSSDVQGFGNLAVLINPAFEAQLYSPLSDVSVERATYFQSQLPVMAIMTSEADTATGTWFPIGRWLSTRFEKERKISRWNPISKTTETIDQHDTNVVSVGHFPPYKTHDLRPHAQVSVEAVKALSPAESARSVQIKSQDWENDAPGSEIEFPGTLLTRTANSAGRDPYLVIRVNKSLIPDHNDIWDPRIETFISHLILISGQSSDPRERQIQKEPR